MRVKLLDDNYVIRKVWYFETVQEAMEFLGVKKQLYTGIWNINGKKYDLTED